MITPRVSPTLTGAPSTQQSEQELFQQVSWAQDRQDAIDRHREEQAAELAGKPGPTYVALLREAAAEREARQAEAETAPASKADVGRVAASLARLKEGVFAVTGHKIPL